MNLRKLSDSELAELAANVAVLLAGTQLSAIDPAVRADLITALGTIPVDLNAQVAAGVVADTEKREIVVVRNFLYSEALAWMGRVRDALKTGLAPEEQYAKCGITFPDARGGAYVAVDPTDLVVVGFSNAVNKGQFAGNNANGRVVYEIWRREGDEGPWMKHLLTGKQRFTDTPVTPGQYYEYKVRAVTASTTSNFSNSAVVYGVL